LNSTEASFLHERLFELVVDLSARQFNQLCSELVGLCRFQKKYYHALITDSPQLIRPFVHLLPRVELQVHLSGNDYDRSQFYRWLEEISTGDLQTLVHDISRLYEEVVENIDCYVVDERICGATDDYHCWKMNLESSASLIALFDHLKSWKRHTSAQS